MLLAYFSRTVTIRNLEALRRAGWRLLLSARSIRSTEGFRYALDNGAWTAFQEFREGKRPTADPCLDSFRRAVDQVGAGADFIVVPDIVQGGERSFAMTRYWLRKLRRDRRLKGVVLLVAVQDGFELEPERIRKLLGPRVGIFVGGGDEFKERTLPLWGAMCREAGAWLHAGRVNTSRRVFLCVAAGVRSFDGSSVSKWIKNLAKLEGAARRQTDLEDFLAAGAGA